MAGEGHDAAAMTFPYHRSVAPMLWVMVGLSVVEMMVVHGLVAFWWPRVALILSLASLTALLWMILLIRSFRRLPVTVADGVLTMRARMLTSVIIPVGQIAGLQTAWSAESLRQPDVSNLALLAYPNIVVALTSPVRGRRGRSVRAVAHRLDDPEAFRRWIATLPQAGGLG